MSVAKSIRRNTRAFIRPRRAIFAGKGQGGRKMAGNLYSEVTEITEKNYFFKLGKYQDWLIEHIRTNPTFIAPDYRQNQVLEFLKEPLNDLCISRPKERLSWGIPLPFDANFVTYVWFDALVNYVTAAGFGHESEFERFWPADLHVIGKDILASSRRLLANHAEGGKSILAQTNLGSWLVDEFGSQDVQKHREKP